MCASAYHSLNTSKCSPDGSVMDIELADSRNAQNWTTVEEASLRYLSDLERGIFFTIYLLLFVYACVGNVAAIIVTYRRKHRYIQKTCIISLALSDLITATGIAILCLKLFSQELIVWNLGSFMCSFLPSLPIFGGVCSSAALVGIALDRYRNVVHALKKRWNPEMWICLLSIITVWCFAIGVAYPMYTLFKTQPVRIPYYDYELSQVLFKETYMCLTFKKELLCTYYICLICLVFIPLFLIFLWLNYKVGELVWKHRKPLSQFFKSQRTNQASHDGAASSEINLTAGATSREKRKMRTLKIIIFLMFAFLILRLPAWAYDTIKLVHKFDSHTMWISKYVCTSLILLHCVINPLSYTFLNQTLGVFSKVWKAIKKFCCEVFCFSVAEFEEFENSSRFPRAGAMQSTHSTFSSKTNPIRAKPDDADVKKIYSPGNYKNR